MGFLNVEKVSYGIQALLIFLNISKEAKSLKQTEVETFRAELLDLMQVLSSGKVSCEGVAKDLNDIIEKMNQSLTAPYPLLMTDTPESFVKSEIAAFEHFLNQELKANHLTVQQEAPLFNDSLKLWEKVGVSLTAKEGMKELYSIVEKTNKIVPEEEKYPLPDAEQY